MITLTIDNLWRNRCGAVSGALWANGATGVQEDWMPGTKPPPRQPWDTGPEAPLPERIRLLAWFDEPDRAAIMAALTRWLDAETTLTWAEEPEIDWVQRYEDSLTRIELPNLTIAPPSLAQPGDLIIDPGCGFGTGEHPTTRQILEMLPQVHGKTLLDVGCGSGILALAAARNGFQVHGTEIEELARRNALHNAALNGLELTVDDRQPGQLEPADVVLANLHAELLVGFAVDLERITRDHLLLAGIMIEKEAMVLACFTFPMVDRRSDGEWVALHLKRP